MEYVDECKRLNIIFEMLLALFSIYFLYGESMQLANGGIMYFASFWNYLDILPPLLMLILITCDNLELFKDHKNSDLEAILLASNSLLIWLKFLYFLRIFEKTGYLISIIIEVVKEMKYFLFILMLTIFAFGDSLAQISSTNKEGKGFIDGGFWAGSAYVYNMVLGDFSTDNFGSVGIGFVWVLFLLCTIFNMIIMLNLLIAIISEAFAKVNSVSQ